MISNTEQTHDLDTPLFGDSSEIESDSRDIKHDLNWNIVIVDDESSIHDVTLMALKRFEFQHRKLKFHHAYSAEEAKKLFNEVSDIAIILLDVVMEQDDSGLQLVDYIRKVLNNHTSRIILRTGQPGIAPPQKVIEEYDINDYKDKTELTVQKLNQTIITALRSYRDLKALEQHRIGLEQVISATSYIHSLKEFPQFISGLLTQILAVLKCSEQSVNSVVSAFIVCNSNDIQNLLIEDGVGHFEANIHQEIRHVLEPESVQRITLALQDNKSQFYDNESIVLFLFK